MRRAITHSYSEILNDTQLLRNTEEQRDNTLWIFLNAGVLAEHMRRRGRPRALIALRTRPVTLAQKASMHAGVCL